MEKLFRTSAGRIQELNVTFSRSLYTQIDWSDRLIGII